MISFFNKIDSSFFEVKGQDLDDKVTRLLNDNVISLSIVEENRQMIQGSIQFHDPNHYISRVFRTGRQLDLSWGYNSPPLVMFGSFARKLNRNEFFNPNGRMQRNNIKMVIQNPSGNLPEMGGITYNCNFYGSEYVNQEFKGRGFDTGNKGDVVRRVFFEMGINVMSIDFSRQKEIITKNTVIYQRETNFKFLHRMAGEWGAIFRIGYNARGMLFGLFIDYSKIGDKFYSSQLSHALGGSSMRFDYKTGLKNVISARWANKQGVGGQGANVQIRYGATGEPIFERYVTEGDSVTVWRLVPERISAELENLPIAERTAKMQEFLQAKDFEEVQRYFEPIRQTTAPEGIGYEINVKMVGNPFLTPPCQVMFGEGFPDFLGSKNLKFYCNKVTHKIGNEPYTMDVDVADAFTITGGSFI